MEGLDVATTQAELTVCIGCPIHHYDNCPECFGFGKYLSPRTGELVPVIAAEAHGDKPLPDGIQPCPFCGSVQNGVAT